MKPVDIEALHAAGFIEEPLPDTTLFQAQRVGPAGTGWIRVRMPLPSGAWHYTVVPEGAIVTGKSFVVVPEGAGIG